MRKRSMDRARDGGRGEQRNDQVQTKRIEILLILMGLVTIVIEMFVAPGCGTLQNQQKVHPVPYGGVVEDIKPMGTMYAPGRDSSRSH